MHHTTKDFWKLYYQLPKEIQDIADKNFELLKKDRRHSSLQFKKIEELYSVRVGLSHRALGIEKNRKIYWFWIEEGCLQSTIRQINFICYIIMKKENCFRETALNG